MRRPLLPLAAVAAATLYFSNGSNYSALAGRFPDIVQALGISEGMLGVARTGFTVGMVISMLLLVGWLMNRVRPAVIAAVSLVGYSTAMLLAAVAPSPGWFAAAMALGGLCNSATDVSQAVLAMAVERRHGWRRGQLVAAAEGMQGLGLSAGAGLSWACAGRVPVWMEMAGLLALSIGAALLAAATLFRIAPAANEESRPSSPWWRYSHRLLWLAGLSFVALFLEAALTNWLALFFHHELGMPLHASGLGVTAFAIALVSTRFAGSLLLRWLPLAELVRWGAVALFTGVMVIALAPSAAAATAGAVLAGLGIANVHPAVVATADTEDGRTGEAVTKVNRIGYLGIATDGLVLGPLADALSLRVALGAAALLALVLIWRAGMVQVPPGARAT